MKWSDKEGINREDHKSYLERFAKQFYDGVRSLLDKSVSLETELSKDNLYIEVCKENNSNVEKQFAIAQKALWIDY